MARTKRGRPKGWRNATLRLPILGYPLELQSRERRYRAGEPKPRSIGSNGLTSKERAELLELEAELRAEGAYDARPNTFADCKDDPRPCPWVSCRYHLALDLVAPRLPGRPPMIKINFPARRIDEMEATCALKVALQPARDEFGNLGHNSLDRVGKLMNLTMASIDLYVGRAARKIRLTLLPPDPPA